MTPDRHLQILRTEGDRLAAMPVDALDAPVPSVPGWTVESVVRHTGKVHQWLVGVLAAGPDADLGAVAVATPSLPKGPECLAAYRESLDAICAALANLDPAAPVATFTGHDQGAFWFRRQAHEVSVHRIDAADAVHAPGGPIPEPLDVDTAADGVDEWIRLFLGKRWEQRFGAFPEALTGRTLHIHGTDDPTPADGAEWLVTFTGAAANDATGSGVEVAATHAKGDVALRGPAQDLLLALWRRRPLDLLDVIGDRALAQSVIDLATF